MNELQTGLSNTKGPFCVCAVFMVSPSSSSYFFYVLFFFFPPDFGECTMSAKACIGDFACMVVTCVAFAFCLMYRSCFSSNRMVIKILHECANFFFFNYKY